MSTRSLIAAVLAASGLFFAAGKADAGIQKRIRRQNHRIMNGYRSGKISEAEVHRLMVNQQNNQYRAQTEGRNGMSKQERRDMQRRLNHQDKLIKRLKHNNVHR